MASWLVGTPGETNRSCFRNKYLQERVEAKPTPSAPAPKVPTTTTTATTPATQTKLNPTAIKSRVHTNERARAVFIC